MVDELNPEPVGAVIGTEDGRGRRPQITFRDPVPFKSDGRSILGIVSGTSAADDADPATLNTVIIFSIFFFSMLGLILLSMSFPEFEE